jgi:hypothetical protein
MASKRGLRSAKGLSGRSTCFICDGIKQRSLNSLSPHELPVKNTGGFHVKDIEQISVQNGNQYIREISAVPLCTEPTREEHFCETCGVHYGEYQDESHAKEDYTEILSMLPREVRMEEPEQLCMEDPPRTQ